MKFKFTFGTEKQNHSKYKIKKEFVTRNNFLYYCKLCLISMVDYTDKHTLVSEQINYRSDKDRLELEKAINNNQMSAEQWLNENGYKDAAYNLYYKRLFISLLVDFSNYFNASIDMASEGNINVAWALLRKPLQESLAYFEWLYVNKNELIKLMFQGDVKEYEIMSKKLKGKRKEHIKTIQSQIGSGKIDMYDFRYSYEKKLTINGILQATNHLVTTRPKLKTSPSNLNYIFMDDELYNRNIGFYYTSIPSVMKYSMEIIMRMFEGIAKLGDYTILMNHINLWLKMFCAVGTPFETVKELFGLNEIDLYCPQCGKKYNSDEAWIDFSNNKFKCNRCGKQIATFRYIFDFENLHLNIKRTDDFAGEK